MIDQALLAEFIIESNEHLDEMEVSMLRLDQAPDDRSIYDDLFRNIHSIKGGAQYLELEKVSRLTHAMEDLLDPLRDGTRQSSAEHIDLLIDGRDRLSTLLKELEESQAEQSDITDLLERLKQVVGTNNSDNDVFPDLVFDDSETDNELYTVFISNLEDKHTTLCKLVETEGQSLDTDSLMLCEDLLDNLLSSSRYMSYEAMTEFMSAWIAAIAEKVDRQEPIQVEFMKRRLDHLANAMGENVTQTTEKQDVAVTDNGPDGIDTSSSDNTQTGPNGNISGQAPLADEDDEPEDESEDIDQDLLPEFLLESHEHLDEVERLLLELEKSPDDVDTMNGIFRLIHSIKGGAQFVGLVRVSKLAHRIEDLLGLLRSGQRQSSGHIVDIFIEGRDRLQQLFAELEEQGRELTPVNDLVSQLNAHIESDTAAPVQVQEPPATGIEPAQEAVSDPGLAVSNMDISDEEQDRELFEIYARHHHEQLSQIKKHLHDSTTTPGTSALQHSSDCVGKLRNSAAYMGYDDQVMFYDQWLESIQQKLAESSSDTIADYQFMQPFLERASTIIPPQEPETVTATDETKVSASNDIADDADITAERDEAEETLLDRLSDALDGSMQLRDESETVETLHEVLDEILHINTGDASEPGSSEDIAEAAEPAPPQASKTTETATSQKTSENEKTPSRETDTGKSKRSNAFKKSVRVDAEKIDSLMNQVGELVVDRSYFFQLFTEMRNLQSYLKDNVGLEQKDMKQIRSYLFKLSEAIASLNRTSNELQEGVMKIRMLPIAQLFNRYPRLVHDLTRKNKKRVHLEVKGEDTELDKMVVEELSDPLVHMIRNAIDHGIESPEERKKAGKPETGNLLLEAYQESNHIVIEVTDDGKGIDTQSIREKALEKELYSAQELDRMSDKEIIWLVMSAGFSTSDTISDTSGRGVGMDVVKKNIEKLNGTIEIESIPGVQTQVRLKIPLTLAIISALQIQVKNSLFTIPLANVEETLSISASDTTLIEGTEVIHLRGQTLPIFRLSSLFNLAQDTPKDEFFVVVASAGMQKIGLVVDELIGQSEVVIKPLVDYLQERSGFSGATIMGDGRISLILDIYELVNMTAQDQILRHRNRIPPKRTDIQKAPARVQ